MYGRKNTEMDVITIKLEMNLIGNFNTISTEIDVQKLTLFRNEIVCVQYTN